MSTTEAKKEAARTAIKLRDDGRAQMGNLQEIMQIAKVAIAAQIVPSSMKTEAQVAVALMTGAELGIGPMFSLRNIYIINGRACIWGDLGFALIQKSGTLAAYEETVHGEEDEDLSVTVRAVRRGQEGAYEATFSWADAKRAGLLSKKTTYGPWLKDMLRWRARWRVLRTGWADVLGGLVFAEIASDFPPIEKQAPREVPLEDFESVSSVPLEAPDEDELTEEKLVAEHARIKAQMAKDAEHQAKMDEQGGEDMPADAEVPFEGPALDFD